MRMRAVRQNCDSNFSRLARQRKLPAVAARLFFYLTVICSGGKQVLGNEVSVKKLVELLESTTVVSSLFSLTGIFFLMKSSFREEGGEMKNKN